MLGFILFLLCIYFLIIFISSIIYIYLNKTITMEHLSVFTGPSSVDLKLYATNPLTIFDPIIKNKLFYNTKVRAYNVDTSTKEERENEKWNIFDDVKKNRLDTLDNPNLTEAEKKQFEREEKVR